MQGNLGADFQRYTVAVNVDKLNDRYALEKAIKTTATIRTTTTSSSGGNDCTNTAILLLTTTNGNYKTDKNYSIVLVHVLEVKFFVRDRRSHNAFPVASAGITTCSYG